jgi:hypothetical protein
MKDYIRLCVYALQPRFEQTTKDAPFETRCGREVLLELGRVEPRHVASNLVEICNAAESHSRFQFISQDCHAVSRFP